MAGHFSWRAPSIGNIRIAYLDQTLYCGLGWLLINERIICTALHWKKGHFIDPSCNDKGNNEEAKRHQPQDFSSVALFLPFEKDIPFIRI